MFAKDLESDRKAALRQSALDHLWMHNRDWVTMAEEGGIKLVPNSNSNDKTLLAWAPLAAK